MSNGKQSDKRIPAPDAATARMLIELNTRLNFSSTGEELVQNLLAELLGLPEADSSAVYLVNGHDMLCAGARNALGVERGKAINVAALDVGKTLPEAVLNRLRPEKNVATHPEFEGLATAGNLAAALFGAKAPAGVLICRFAGDEIPESAHSLISLIAAIAGSAMEWLARKAEVSYELDIRESTLMGAPNGVVAVNDRFEVVLANKAARAILSIPDNPVGRSIGEFLRQEKFTAALGKVVASDAELERLEMLLGEHGAERLYNVIVCRPGMKTTPGATIIMQDITERRKLDEHVQRISRVASIGQLAAGIAHEIRNPLTGMSITLDTLYEEEGLSQEARELISDVGHEVERLEALINGILDFARPQAVQCRVMRLVKALEWHRSFAEQCKKKNVDFSFQLDVNPKIMGDPERLKQVFLNLAINALDATEPGGKIVLSTELVEEPSGEVRVAVEISDDGVGMDEEMQRSVFNPFFTTKNDGTGLGLSIAHSIIEQHEGRVDLTSAPGLGSSFTVTLPVTAPGQEQNQVHS